MPLVPAKCPECGGNINIDPNKKAAVCEYCKQPFIVQEAIQNFNTTYNITNNVSNDIKADVVNVYENKNSDFVIEAGVLKEYKGEDTLVTIPNGVKSIGKECFEDMTYLESVLIPESVTFIDSWAFSCSGIKTITIPKSVRRIADGAFSGCKNLTEVAYLGDVEEIEYNTFSDCEKLQKVIFPQTLKYINESAFLGCIYLKQINIPDSIEFINRSAFGSDSYNSLFFDTYVESVNISQEVDKRKYVFAFPNIFKKEIEEIIKDIAFGPLPDSFDDTYKVKALRELRNNDFKERYDIPYGEMLYKFIVYHNPIKREDFGSYNINIFDGVFGHYCAYNPYDTEELAYVQECFGCQDDVRKFISKYLDDCNRKRICPYCGKPLSFFGNCKNSYCRGR